MNSIILPIILPLVTATLSQAFAMRQTPVGLLFLMAFAMPLGFSTWLALLSLIALGAAVAVTSLFPSFAGLLITTAIGSLGFQYYETVNQSLQLQWLEKDRAP